MSRLDPRVQGQRAEIRSILRGVGIQAKLAIGAPDDEHEREADRVADEVMRMPDQPTASANLASAPVTTRVQRMCAECDDELQRTPDDAQEERAALHAGATPGGAFVPPTWVSEAIRGLRGGGQPLGAAERAFFEPRFDADFSQVRVHTEPRADRAAASIRARAFTLGRDVVFRAGQYSPGSLAGRRLMAHELTHVIQQGAAGATRSPTRRSPPQPRSRAVQRQLGDEGAEEPALTRPEEIALSRSSPGQFTGEAQPLALSLYNFGIDVAQPKAEHRAVVTELGGFPNAVATAPTIVRVIGFADATGNDRYNLRLSRRRADAVKAILQPLISQRISLSAYGETNPAATNETVTGRSRNRRVDIRFVDARPPTPHPPPRPRPVPPGQRPPPPGPTPGPPPGRRPPGGGGGDDDQHFCVTYPLLCGIGVTPFFLPLICVVAPELCLAVTCVLAPELCLIPPPPPPPPPDEPPRRDDDDGRPIVVFVPDVRAPNTPAPTRDRVGLRDPVSVQAIVTNPPAVTAPITIDVDGVGANAGVATINGQSQIQITGTTSLEIRGTTMSAEGFAFNPYLQLAAWWGNDLVGASNRFAVSSIAQDWSVALDGVERTRYGYAFYTRMDWTSDSGAYRDLDACRYVELVGLVSETGGLVGFGIGEVDDPDDIATADLHPTFDQHGTPHEYTRVAGSQRLKQLWRIRDMRSNSGWAPSRNSGFHIDRRFERDPSNPRCWRLIVEKTGAAVTIGGLSSGAGSGSARHVFRNINCDPPPPPPTEDEPPTHDEPPPIPDEPPPTHDEPPTPDVPPPCDRDELARRVDACIEQARRSAIRCTLGVIPFAGGLGGIVGGVRYLRCLERMRRALLECDRRAKEDTHCPDSPPPPAPDPEERWA